MDWCSGGGSSDATSLNISSCIRLPIAWASFAWLILSSFVSLRFYQRRARARSNTLDEPLVLGVDSDYIEEGPARRNGRYDDEHSDSEQWNIATSKVDSCASARCVAIASSLVLATLSTIILVNDITPKLRRGSEPSLVDTEWLLAAIGWLWAAWLLRDEKLKGAEHAHVILGDKHKGERVTLRLHKISLYVWASLQFVVVLLAMLTFKTSDIRGILSMLMLLFSGLATTAICYRNAKKVEQHLSSYGGGINASDDGMSIDGYNEHCWGCFCMASSRLHRSPSASDRIRKSAYTYYSSDLRGSSSMFSISNALSTTDRYEPIDNSHGVDIDGLLHTEHAQIRTSSFTGWEPQSGLARPSFTATQETSVQNVKPVMLPVSTRDETASMSGSETLSPLLSVDANLRLVALTENEIIVRSSADYTWRVKKTESQLFALNCIVNRELGSEYSPTTLLQAPLSKNALQKFCNELENIINRVPRLEPIILLFFETGRREAVDNETPNKSPFIDINISRGSNGRINCILERCKREEDDARRIRLRQRNEIANVIKKKRPLNDPQCDNSLKGEVWESSTDPQELASDMVTIFVEMLRVVDYRYSASRLPGRSGGRAAFLSEEDLAIFDTDERKVLKPNWADLLRLRNAISHTTAAHTFRHIAAKLCAAPILQEMKFKGDQAHEYLLSSLLNITNAATAYAVLAGLPFPGPCDNVWNETASRLHFQHEAILFQIGDLVLSANDLSHSLLRAKSSAMFSGDDKPNVAHNSQGQSRRRNSVMPMKRNSVILLGFPKFDSNNVKSSFDMPDCPQDLQEHLNPFGSGADAKPSNPQQQSLALTHPEPLVTFCLFTASIDSPKLRVFYPHSVRVMMHIATDEYLTEHIQVGPGKVELPFMLRAFGADVRNRAWRGDDYCVSHWRREFELLRRNDAQNMRQNKMNPQLTKNRDAGTNDVDDEVRGFNERAQHIADHDFSLRCIELMMGLPVDPRKNWSIMGEKCKSWFSENGFNDAERICEALVRDDFLEAVQDPSQEYHPHALYRFARSEVPSGVANKNYTHDTLHEFYGFLWGHLFHEEKRRMLRDLFLRNEEVSRGLFFLLMLSNLKMLICFLFIKMQGNNEVKTKPHRWDFACLIDTNGK